MFKKAISYLIIVSLVWNQTALAMMNNGEDEGDQRKIPSRQFDAQAQPLFNNPKSKGQRSLSDPPPPSLSTGEEEKLSMSLSSRSVSETFSSLQDLLQEEKEPSSWMSKNKGEEEENSSLSKGEKLHKEKSSTSSSSLSFQIEEENPISIAIAGKQNSSAGNPLGKVEELLPLLLEMVKEARKGDGDALAEVEQFIERFSLSDTEKAKNAIDFLKGIQEMNLPIDVRSSSRATTVINEAEPLLAQESKHYSHFNLPDTLDPAISKKVLAALVHINRYTFDRNITKKQYFGMLFATLLGGVAVYPNVVVFENDIDDLQQYLASWYHIGGPPLISMVSYVKTYIIATSILDYTPRMAWYLKRALSPPTKEFSLPQKIRGYVFAGLIGVGALLPAVIKGYYWYISQSSVDSIDPLFYPFLPFYALEGYLWGVDQLGLFKNGIEKRFFKEKPPVSEAHNYRQGLLKGFQQLLSVLYVLPDALIKTIYENVFDNTVLETLKQKDTEASEEDVEAMFAFLRIKYLMEMVHSLAIEEEPAKKCWFSLKDWISGGIVITGSVARAMILYTLLSFVTGLTNDTYDLTNFPIWILAALSFIPRTILEVRGNNAFGNFLWDTSPQSESALKGLRNFAKLYTPLEALWNNIPLMGLCLSSGEVFFSPYSWATASTSESLYIKPTLLFIFLPLIISESTGKAVTLADTYVKNIPTNINRAYNTARRKLKFENTIGYMRDEIMMLVERLSKLVENLDEGVLMFFKENIMEESWAEPTKEEI